ncbi:MAG TPA: 3-isopropylmalate dehydrogenase, partial [Paludibacteraceae bacterium]|nr:3-isopropylmalate dehydrogenase [Paludibacteraceae bacterium]
REAVDACITAGVVTEDIASGEKAYKTSEVGEWITNYILKKK